MQRVLNLLRETEAGVRAFQRSKKWREAAKVILCTMFARNVKSSCLSSAVFATAYAAACKKLKLLVPACRPARGRCCHPL
jgi:hypothetical protein